MENCYELKKWDDLVGCYCYEMKGFMPSDWGLKHNRVAMKERIYFASLDGIAVENGSNLVCNKFIDDKDCFSLGLEPRSQVKIQPDELKVDDEFQVRFDVELDETKEDGYFFEITDKSIMDLDKPEPILRLGVKDGMFEVCGWASGLKKEKTCFNKPIEVKWNSVMKLRIDCLLLDNNEGYLRIYMDDGKQDVLVWSNSENTTMGERFKRLWFRIGVVGGLNRAVFSKFSIHKNDF
jgi:hypothetical protein